MVIFHKSLPSLHLHSASVNAALLVSLDVFFKGLDTKDVPAQTVPPLGVLGLLVGVAELGEAGGAGDSEVSCDGRRGGGVRGGVAAGVGGHGWRFWNLVGFWYG